MGARAVGKRINTNVMKQTAKLLMSDDPKKIEQAMKLAARSPQHMAAVDAITKLAAPFYNAMSAEAAGAAISR